MTVLPVSEKPNQSKKNGMVATAGMAIASILQPVNGTTLTIN